MSTIARAFCVELNEVVTADQARREYLSLESPPSRFTFYCSEAPCREKKVRVTCASYRSSAQEVEKFVAAHFRRLDEHLPGCCWLDDQADIEQPLPNENEHQFRRRRAKRKLTDFVDVFDPTLEEPKPSTTPSKNGGSDDGGMPVGTGGRHGSSSATDNGLTKTRYLDKLVDTYLEAKAHFSREEFVKLSVRVVGIGEIPLSQYFLRIQWASLGVEQRVLFGGARFEKDYGEGFKLRFYDKVLDVPVFLYISPSMMKSYRYRRYLRHIVDKHDTARYLNVYVLGTLRANPSGKSVDLIVEDLRHLTIHLGPANIPDDGSLSAETTAAER